MSFPDQLQNCTPRIIALQQQQPTNQQLKINPSPSLTTEHNLEQNQPSMKQTYEQEPMPTGWTRFIQLPYYKQYFKINENDVINRVKAAITLPYTNQFIDQIQPNPDFYGPFWILTTIVFLLGSVGNFSNYLLSKFSEGEVWQSYFFKLQYVREAVVLVYSYGLGLPAFLYFFFKFMSVNTKFELSELICLYGYSLSCFVPAIVVCILPVGLIQWLALLYGLVNSSLFLAVNIEKHAEGIQKVVIYSIVGGLQFILFLCFKLIFLSLLGNQTISP